MKTIFTTLLTSVLLAASVNAQDDLDITLFDTGSAVEVRVRPEADFNGVFSSLTFTLRWEAGSTIAWGGSYAPPEAGINMAPSGPVHTDGGYSYHSHAGFGFAPLSDLGTSWVAGGEYTVLSISYTGSGSIELVNDAWTAANNGDYYVSLNGVDHTGMIYASDSSTGLTPEPDTSAVLRAWPVPAVDRVHYMLPVAAGVARVRLLDGSGRVVMEQEHDGQGAGEFDLNGLAPGRYILHVAGGTDHVEIIKR